MCVDHRTVNLAVSSAEECWLVKRRGWGGVIRLLLNRISHPPAVSLNRGVLAAVRHPSRWTPVVSHDLPPVLWPTLAGPPGCSGGQSAAPVH